MLREYENFMLWFQGARASVKQKCRFRMHSKIHKLIANLKVNYLKYGTNDVIKLLYDRISMLVQGSLTNQQGYETPNQQHSLPLRDRH